MPSLRVPVAHNADQEKLPELLGQTQVFSSFLICVELLIPSLK
jgi:hypothetical protein